MVKGKLLGISLAFLTIVLAALFAFLLLRGNYTLNEKVVANKNDEIVTVLVDDYVRKNKDSFFRASNCKVTILDGDKDVTETFFEDFKTEDNVLNKRYENKVYTFKIKGLFLDKEVKFKFSYEDYRIINRDGTPIDYFNVNEDDIQIMYKTDRHFNDGFLCFADSENEEPVSKYLSVDNIKDCRELYFVNPKNTTGTIEIVYVVNGTDRIIHVEERKKGLNELESYTPDLSALGVQGYKLSDSAPSSLVYDFNKKVVRYVEMDNEKWATVTIDYDNGAPLQTIPVLKGDVVAHPGVIPTKESVDQNTTYRFLGFQKEGEAGKYNFDDVVESSFKLKATYEKQEGVDVLDNDPSYVKVTIKYVDVDDSNNPLYSTDIRREKNTVESFDIHYLTGYSPVDSFTNNQVEINFDSDKVIEIKLKKENNIIVAFDFDNGQKTYANFSVGDKVILPTQTPQKPKIGNKTFTFKYWSLDGENKFDEETTLTRNIELIAVYEVTISTEENGSIKIVFKDVDTNEDIQNPMLKEGLLNSFESIIIPEVDGYVFDGTEDLIAVQYTTPTRVYVLSYKKLAVIEENESRIIFKFVDVDRIRLLHVEEIVGEIGTSREYTNTFTKEGYELVDPSQTSINVTFESESKIIKINYKIKETRSYTIIFNSNGGKGNIPNIVADEDQEVTLTKNVFTKDGYKFIGWSLTADGEVAHADEAEVTNLTTGTSVTLYAKWEANKYTIKFNNNSGTGSMESIEATYDKNITLTKNSFTKSGFNFGGWSRDGSSEAEFYDEDEVKNLTTQTEVTLYAVWINIGLVNYTEEIYLEKIDSPVDKVDYTVADFLLDSDKTKVYQGLADAIATAKTTSLEGFAIKDELSIKTGTIKADGSLVLKLYFVRNRGNVEYRFDSGSHQVRLKYGDTITKHFSDLDPQIQKPNFKVAGWTCSGADYSFGETMGLDDIILNAKYQRNKWQVRFNCKVEEVDGSFVDRAVSDNNFYANSASVSYTYNVAGFEVETFYYTVPMAYSSEDEIIDVTVGADKNINRKSVNVKYELEGVGALTSGSLPATTRYKYEEEVTLPTGLAATGYNFAGFFKGAQQVSGSFSISVADCNEPTGTVVIKVRFSEFESVPYDIVYYKELGNVDAKIDESTYSKDTHFTQSDSTTLTATIDSQVTLDISTPEFMNKYAGFTPKNLLISVHSGTAGKGADRLTLEVFYVRDRHKVLFDLDGGSSGIEELEYTYKYEDVISNHFATDLPTKENYAFKHFTDISGSGAFAFGTAQMANEDINLKAIYERNKWKITYSYQEELVNGTYSQTKYVTSTEFYSKSDTFNETLTKAGFTSVNISIQIPADYSDFTNDTYSHDTIYKLNRKTVELKFVDGEPLVPFTTGSLPLDAVYKFGQTYNLPVLAKEGYTFDGYKSSVTSTYYVAGNYVVGLTDVESASITFTAEFTALPLDRGITLQYQYQKGPGDWVTIDTETLTGYDNETRTVNLKEFDEFDLVGAATLEVVFDQASKTQRVEVKKDSTKWTKITFKAGPNSSVETTEFEVVINRPFNGLHQPTINPPKINPDEGYKNMDDPADYWSPEFKADGQVSGPQTFTARVQVDKDQKFSYTVNYLEQGDDGNTVRTAKTGYHEVGTLNLGSHPTIAGYNCVTGTTTLTITTNPASNVLNVYYEKNPAQWTKLTVVVGNKGTNPSTTDYDVIKNHPLGGDNQPKITFPSVTAVAGYKVHDTQPWSPAYDPNEQLTGPKVINANIVEDPDQWTTLTFVIGDKATASGILKYDVIKGISLSGANQPKITLPTITSVAAGYKVHDTKPWDPAYNSTEVLTGPKTINANIVVDPDQWVDIEFVAGPNSTVTKTQFKVIKNLSFEGANQPSITPPEITPATGYKKMDSLADYWSPEFKADGQVSGPQTFTARVQVDEDQKFSYTVNYLEQGNDSNVLHDPMTTGTHHVGTLNLGSHPTIAGYNCVTGTTMTITADPTLNVLNVYYTQDPTQWTTLTFVIGDKATASGTLKYDVIKGISLSGANQPEITLPTITSVAAGYKVHDTKPWDPAYNSTEVLTGPKVINANIVEDPNQWVTIKFVAGANSTVSTTQFKVIKNLSFEGANQPSVNPPTINPAAGYKITNNPAQDWDPGFTASMQVSGPQTFTAKVVLDPDQWRNVTVKHIGQDLSGNYTVTLKTESTVNVVIGSKVNLTSDSFTGFTYDTSNPATYTVTDGASPQIVSINYSRNKHTITFDPTDGSPTPNAMTDVYCDQGVLNSLVVTPAPTRTGYTLDGWTINDTGTKLTAAYKMPDENITLKAVWKANTYKVIFHSNYGDGTDNTTEQTITYDVPTHLDQNPFGKTGYGFTGWATTPTGEKEYDDKHRVTNLSTGKNYHLYAVWEFLGYDVTLNLNGGSIEGETEDPVIKQVKEFPYTLPNATKYINDNEYYEFLGWYNTNDTTGTRYTILTNPQEYTLYAMWGNIVYHVGEYPQTKVTDTTLITALNDCEVTTSQQTVATSKSGYSHLEEWYTVEYGGNKYEKVGDDYFKYEPIVCYKLSNGLYYSKYVIDSQVFDYDYGNTKDYNNSYVKRYLENVFKVKAGLSSARLFSKPEILNLSDFPDPDARKATQTDYANAAWYGYRSKITEWSTIYHSVYNYWTSTGSSYYSNGVCSIYSDGGIDDGYYGTGHSLGLRVIVSA